MPDQASPDLMMIELEKAAHLKDINVSHIVRIYREKFADPLDPRYKPTSWNLLEHIGRHKKDLSTAPPVNLDGIATQIKTRYEEVSTCAA